MTVFYTAVSPLVMLAFVGFSLKIPTTSTSIPPAWCGIVAARILRKVITPHVITHNTYNTIVTNITVVMHFKINFMILYIIYIMHFEFRCGRTLLQLILRSLWWPFFTLPFLPPPPVMYGPPLAQALNY